MAKQSKNDSSAPSHRKFASQIEGYLFMTVNEPIRTFFPGTLITRQRLKRLCSHTHTLSLSLAPLDITFIAIFFSFCRFGMAHKDLEARLKSIFFPRDTRITLS